MKTVFSSNSEVAHAWATQETSRGRCNGSLFFEGNTIYSYGYHFPIAKHVMDENNFAAVLFTTRGYSVSTSKHIGYVGYACNHLNIIYCNNPNNSHTDNFKDWENNIVDTGKKLLKARKPVIYLDQIRGFYEQARKYAGFFNIPIPESLNVAYNFIFTDEHKELLKAEHNQLLERLKLQKAEDQARVNAELEKWRRFETQYSRMHNRVDFDYLRFNPVSGFIQTSQGLDIPLDEGKMFYNIVKLTIQKGGCKNCNMRFLHYVVKEINKDFIQVGCHKISFGEVILLANSLNW